VILLSLALVVVAATTLAWGVFASSDPLIWVSLAAGLGAVASVAGSVVRHRRHLVPEAIPDAGHRPTGSAAVGAASAGIDPAPSPTPSRPAPSAPAPPAAGPASPPGTWPGAEPGAQPWPWSTPPPGGPETGARRGWTGPVPVPPRPADEAPTPAAAEPQAPPADDAPAPTPPEPPADDASEPAGEPGIERVAVRDALRVAQLDDEVLVLDGHPRYHLAGCLILAGTETGTETIPLAVSAARRAGFTPCAECAPDSTLLARSRERAQQKAQQKAQDPATEWPTDDGQQL
jgi:hypothetical protein